LVPLGLLARFTSTGNPTTWARFPSAGLMKLRPCYIPPNRRKKRKERKEKEQLLTVSG